MFENILYSQQSESAIITINRPEVYNAMNRQTKLEIIEAVKLANENSKIKAIILTGNGKAFSSGQDLSDRSVQGNEAPVDLGHTLATEWNPLARSLKYSAKPVIGAINGVCAGAGISVALSCDFLIAKPKVKFVSGFAQIGLTPDAGSCHTFVKVLGHQRAMAFAMLGEPLFSEDLFQLGLINAIADDEMEKAISWAKKISELPPLAVGKIKENFIFALDHSFEQTMEKELKAQQFLGQTHDYQEGLKAFFEKRKPHFQGR